MSEEQVEELERNTVSTSQSFRLICNGWNSSRERRLSKSEFRELGKDKVGGDFRRRFEQHLGFAHGQWQTSEGESQGSGGDFGDLLGQ